MRIQKENEEQTPKSGDGDHQKLEQGFYTFVQEDYFPSMKHLGLCGNTSRNYQALELSSIVFER